MPSADAVRVEKSSTASDPELLRNFTWWNSFTLGFAFISPIVGLYAVLGIGLETVGPGFWWGFVICLAGQSTVAWSFTRMARHWPFEGSSYQWSRRLVGEAWGWYHGWIYIATMCVATAVIAYATSVFLLPIVGVETDSNLLLVGVSLALIAFTTVLNIIGRWALKIFLTLCIWAEVIGSLGLGTVLLLFYRVNDFSVLTQGLEWGGWSNFMMAPLVLGSAYAAWALIGFDSAATIGEEVKDPERALPRGIMMACLVVGFTFVYAGLAVILAVPDLGAVAAGLEADPVVATFNAIWPTWVVKLVLADFVVAFIACLLAVQAAASRLVWAFARDRDLPGSGFLVRLSKSEKMPVNAILVVGIVGAAVFIFTGTNIFLILLAMATAGYYLVFVFPILGSFVARSRGTWPPSDGRSNPLHLILNVVALVWLIAMTIIIIWPRYSDISWQENWGSFIGLAGVVVLGFVLRMYTVRTREKTIAYAEDRGEA